MTTALLLTISLGACSQTKSTPTERVATATEAALIAQLKEAQLQASKTLPEYPEECRVKFAAGVEAGENPLIALRRYDITLSAANDRIITCADWYDEIKTEFESTNPAQEQDKI